MTKRDVKKGKKKQAKNKFDKEEAWVKVTDNWYPCFEGNLVRLSFYKNQKRICAWGEDDFGMEKENSTLEEFEILKNMILSVEILKKLGFIYA